MKIVNECLKIHRVSQTCSKKSFLRPLSGFFRHLNQLIFACHIGTYAKIGKGCTFQHNGVGVVISDHASLGNDCVIYQNVTVGVLEDGCTSAPTIHDGVVIGAGAIILGGVTIGENAKIGAGAVVIGDVPAGSTAVGVPARVINHSNSPM